MILKKEIQKKAELWNVSPNTVDKDYVLGHFLSSFYNTENNRDLFIFKAPEDFFDVWYLMNNVTFDESVNFKKLLIEKCAGKNVRIDPDIFNDEQAFEIVSRAWKSSIAHHLPVGKLPDVEKVWKYLSCNLFPKLIKF